MVKLSDLQVGDEVILKDVNRTPQKVRIVRVGRTNIYIKNNTRVTAFDRVTGAGKDKYGHNILITVEEHEQSLEAKKARQILRPLGIDLQPYLSAERTLLAFEALQNWIASAPPQNK